LGEGIGKKKVKKPISNYTIEQQYRMIEEGGNQKI